MVFDLFVLNRVIFPVCPKQGVYFVICPKQGPKMEGVVLHRVVILGPLGCECFLTKLSQEK